jgi:glyceraldehyde-3-phosphate dehydrogenase (ferredoxin)
MRVAGIDASDGARVALQAPEGALGPVDVGIAWAGEGATVMGAGPLADLEVPGSQRLVLCGESPAWRGFYVSTIGSAALPLRALGLDAAVLRGRAARTSVLFIEATRAHIEPVELPARWTVTDLITRLRARARHAGARVLAVGPAAAYTRIGAVASSSRDGVIDTWAGRGGFGSRLWREHGLCGVVLDVDAPRAPVHVDARMVGATTKYRYHPLLGTGGTFGSNFSTLREKFLGFNARTIYATPEERDEWYARLVQGHYLRQYKEEQTGTKGSHDCGETCPAVCKKFHGPFKKDYQPYAALGPNCGIFDQRAAEGLADRCDELGFDSVDAGALIAWRLECDGRARFEGAGFDPVEDSRHNARLAMEIAERLLDAPLSDGIRAAAAHTSQEDRERALYVAHGDAGAVSPNQYWAPGMVAPVPISGKYYVDYSLEFAPPRELGRRCAERMVRELALDNLGLCRFQREWAEERLDEMLRAPPGTADAHHRALARRIASLSDPRPWETARTRDLVATYLEEARRDGPPDAELDAWCARFREGPGAYWREVRAGVAEGLAAQPAQAAA